MISENDFHSLFVKKTFQKMSLTNCYFLRNATNNNNTIISDRGVRRKEVTNNFFSTVM